MGGPRGPDHNGLMGAAAAISLPLCVEPDCDRLAGASDERCALHAGRLGAMPCVRPRPLVVAAARVLDVRRPVGHPAARPDPRFPAWFCLAVALLVGEVGMLGSLFFLQSDPATQAAWRALPLFVVPWPTQLAIVLAAPFASMCALRVASPAWRLPTWRTAASWTLVFLSVATSVGYLLWAAVDFLAPGCRY